MVFVNEEDELDACIVDVGAYNRRPFSGKVNGVIPREEFPESNFIQIYEQMVGDLTFSKKVLEEYEKQNPGRLEQLMLEYKSEVSFFYQEKYYRGGNREYKEYGKRRGFIVKEEEEEILSNILFSIDRDYYSTTQFSKRKFDWSDKTKKEFSIVNTDDTSQENLQKAFRGIDLAYQAALDLDLTLIRSILNDEENPQKAPLSLEGRLPQLHLITNSFNEDETISGEIFLDDNNFFSDSYVKAIGESGSLFAKVPVSLKDYIFGDKKSFVFDHSKVEGLFVQEYLFDKSNMDVVQREIEIPKIEVEVSRNMGVFYYTQIGEDIIPISTAYSNLKSREEFVSYYNSLPQQVQIDSQESFKRELEWYERKALKSNNFHL